MTSEGIKIVANNKKARHDYFIEETLEAGIVLTGTEVKSIRLGKVNLKDSYATIKNEEMFIHNMHISHYEQGNINNTDPLRTRKLLLHKKQIIKLMNSMSQDSLSVVPLQVYFSKSKVKIQIGVAKGKKLYDKRQDIAKKEANRDIQRRLKDNQR
jgi:SsrA-binding protein